MKNLLISMAIFLILADAAPAGAAVSVPPMTTRAGGVVILVCNEDPSRSPVYLPALPWDPALVSWATQRAAYVRELDLQTLLREPGERYRLLQGLVEAKFRLELARIALMAHHYDEVLEHWEKAAQATRQVRWKGTERLFGEAATQALKTDLERQQAGNPCGLVGARERLEAAYGELAALIETGK